ncbi:MAG: chemotaxis response regulator protein-glutamate methylesterase [Verrucomicrobiota bacterium]
MAGKRIRTLVVDDSALVRRAVAESLARDPEIEVVGTAPDPYVARDQILALCPDVMTLDIEMPRMDGLTFLKIMMKHRPMPVVIMSSLTEAGSAKALEAIQAGAVEVISKPTGSFSVHEDGARLAEKIKAAAQARIISPIATTSRPAAVHSGNSPAPRRYPARQLILMGASTGGTEALTQILTHLSPDLPGICIVQHIPAHFSLAFARRLNELSRLEVREAADGDTIEPGLALVAPGGRHLLLRWTGSHYCVRLSDGPLIHYQRPAVDVLFDSAVKSGAAPSTLGLLLTGMGADGAAGLLHLREGGATTAAQDERTSVVFGMPREAIKLGAAERVLGLEDMAQEIERYASAHATT